MSYDTCNPSQWEGYKSLWNRHAMFRTSFADSVADGGQADSLEKSRGNPWPGRCVKVTRDNLPLTAGKGEVNNSRRPDSSMPRTRGEQDDGPKEYRKLRS